MKTNSERTVEGLTWAAVVIWLGFVLIAHILDYVFIVIMVLGIIFLSSAIYQRSRGWHTSLGIWVFGIWMAVFSVLETVSGLLSAGGNGRGLNIDLWVYLGVALLSMGAAAILRSVNSGALLGLTDPATGTSGRTGITSNGASPYIPRPVDDDLSTGWIDPNTSASSYGTQGVQRRTGAQRTGFSEQPTYQAGWDQPGWDQPASEQPTYQPGWNQPGAQTQATQWGADQWQTQAGQWNQGQQTQWGQPQQPQASYDAGWDTPMSQSGYNNAQQVPGGSANYAPWQPPQPQAQPPSQPPQVNSSELQARIEDIIQRSRERRTTQGSSEEDLPY